jgi:hypothetical protein
VSTAGPPASTPAKISGQTDCLGASPKLIASC